MGVSASGELIAPASVSDLATVVRRMRVLPALPVGCQMEALRSLWRSLHWVPPKSEVLSLSNNYDRLFVVVKGEVEVLSANKCIPIMPAGSFFCEAALLQHGSGAHKQQTGSAVRGGPCWPLTRCTQRLLPLPAVELVEVFLRRCGPRVAARVQTTQQSLIASLTRQELMRVAELQNCSAALHEIDGLPLACNSLRNVTRLNAEARILTSQDMAALRHAVCKGSTNASCQGTVLPARTNLHCSLFDKCMRPCTEGGL
mmetsp:Transcript_81507/g.161819  ORF Transcript_81507/g.161819 Transcript_81507/m.161819 type:complete len:257 (+) Transcript_81507:80-850(+)